MTHHQMKQYDIRTVVAFKKTTDKWGELSNMCAGFPVVVNDVPVKSVEALYQACRFPDFPDVQRKILEQSSPMTAKMVGKPHIAETRKDWEQVRVLIMKWVLRVKLAQNWEAFSKVLLESADKDIVELSNKDPFWGAKPLEGSIVLGVNALGRLLMELRAHIKANSKEKFMSVAPLKIENFKLYGKNITFVYESDKKKIEPPQINMFDV